MPDWLAQTTGMTQGSALLLTVILALLFVIVLAVVLIPLLKRFARTSYKGSRSRQPRLAIMDATDIDARRRLLLVRRDNVEHLIMIGGANDLVVEQSIIRGMPVSTHPRGQALAGNMQTGAYPPAYEADAPQKPDTAQAEKPDWATDAPAKPEASAPAPAHKVEPSPTPEPTKPARPQQSRPVHAAAPAVRPAKPATPKAQASKPAALQTPTIGGARGVQKVAAKPVSARQPASRPVGMTAAKPAAKPAPATSKTPKAEKPQKPVQAKPEAPSSAKPVPMSAFKPPMNGPAAKAASAFLRPQDTTKPEEEKAKSTEAIEDKNAPAPAKNEPAPQQGKEQAEKPQDTQPQAQQTTTKEADNSKAKPAADQKASDSSAEKAPEPAKKKAQKEKPKDAVASMEMEMADLLDDIEANTK